jgi:hypothetical protein
LIKDTDFFGDDAYARVEMMRLAGVRSFGFVGLLGKLSATLADLFDSSILGVALLGFTLMVGVSFGE